MDGNIDKVQLKKSSIIYALKRVSKSTKVTRLSVNPSKEIFSGDCWIHDRELGWLQRGTYYVTFAEVKYYQQV